MPTGRIEEIRSCVPPRCIRECLLSDRPSRLTKRSLQWHNKRQQRRLCVTGINCQLHRFPGVNFPWLDLNRLPYHIPIIVPPLSEYVFVSLHRHTRLRTGLQHNCISASLLRAAAQTHHPFLVSCLHWLLARHILFPDKDRSSPYKRCIWDIPTRPLRSLRLLASRVPLRSTSVLILAYRTRDMVFGSVLARGFS